MRLVFSLSLSLLLLILMATAFQNCTRMQPFSGTGDSSTGVFLPTFDAEGGGGDGVIIDNEIIDYYSCTPMENSNTANFSVLRNNTTNEYIVKVVLNNGDVLTYPNCQVTSENGAYETVIRCEGATVTLTENDGPTGTTAQIVLDSDPTGSLFDCLRLNDLPPIGQCGSIICPDGPGRYSLSGQQVDPSMPTQERQFSLLWTHMDYLSSSTPDEGAFLVGGSFFYTGNRFHRGLYAFFPKSNRKFYYDIAQLTGFPPLYGATDNLSFMFTPVAPSQNRVLISWTGAAFSSPFFLTLNSSEMNINIVQPYVDTESQPLRNSWYGSEILFGTSDTSQKDNVIYKGSESNLEITGSISVGESKLIPVAPLKNGFVAVPSGVSNKKFAVRLKGDGTFEAYHFYSAPKVNGFVFGVDTSPSLNQIAMTDTVSKTVSVFDWPESGPPIFSYSAPLADLQDSSAYMVSISGDYLAAISWNKRPQILLFYKGKLAQEYWIKHGTWQPFEGYPVTATTGQPCWEGSIPRISEFCDYSQPITTTYEGGGFPALTEIELSDGQYMKVIGTQPTNMFNLKFRP